MEGEGIAYRKAMAEIKGIEVAAAKGNGERGRRAE